MAQMSGFMFPVLYLFMAFLVGLCGIGRRPGFLITFLLSLVVTPFLMLLVLHLMRPHAE